jgi:hypothetical protein
MPASCGGIIWHPLPQYTLYPLYCLGLCDATMQRRKLKLEAESEISSCHVSYTYLNFKC